MLLLSPEKNKNLFHMLLKQVVSLSCFLRNLVNFSETFKDAFKAALYGNYLETFFESFTFERRRKVFLIILS